MRLFIAVHLGEEVRAKVEHHLPRLRRLAPDSKWVRPEAMHVTLAFLGHLPEERVPGLCGAMKVAAGRSVPMHLKAQGVGSFGASKHPRVLWVGLVGEAEKLVSLQSALEGELLPLGYQPEKRAFRPHLTMARARDPKGDAGLAKCVTEFHDAEFGDARIDRLILFKSDLSPQGARYTAVEEVALTPCPC